MNTCRNLLIIGLLLALPITFGAEKNQEAPVQKESAGSAAEKAAPAGSAGPSSGSVQTPVYKPPLRGSPGGRVGGGTRGLSGTESVYLQVLAPDHVGLTAQDQPQFYWYISGPVSYPVEFTIIERSAVKPLLEKRIGSPGQAGIQRTRLADYGVRIKAKTPYKWFVSLVIDPDRRSKDVVAGGVVEYVPASQALSAMLKDAGKDGALSVLAGEGLWYDALAFISESIDASPDDAALRRQRSSLLEQIGLKDVAEYDMGYAAPAKAK